MFEYRTVFQLSLCDVRYTQRQPMTLQHDNTAVLKKNTSDGHLDAAKYLPIECRFFRKICEPFSLNFFTSCLYDNFKESYNNTPLFQLISILTGKIWSTFECFSLRQDFPPRFVRAIRTPSLFPGNCPRVSIRRPLI